MTSQPKILNELIESLTQASGAASQLLHHHQDPRWMVIREGLDLAKDGVTQVASIAASKITMIKPL